MMGMKMRVFRTHQQLCLDDLVPQDNFYRKLEANVDLGFVRDLVARFYQPLGRPSIDPVVFFKLQLIMFFEAIRSERLLMTTVAMRLDHRWYIGYDLGESVPDHSSLSKIRDRFGVMVFQEFFDAVVEQCIAAGLVWGDEVHFDGSTLIGNADPDQRLPRFYWEAVHRHLQQQFELSAESQEEAAPIPNLIRKYDGHTRVTKTNSFERQSDYWVNATDSDATPLEHQHADGYRLHYGVDGGRARIILACLVTPAVIHDMSPVLDLTWLIRFRWRQKLKRVVADSRYGSGEILAALEGQGITPFIPPLQNESAKRTPKVYPKSMFFYDSAKDVYVCPEGKVLTYDYTSSGYRRYRAKLEDCKQCPVLKLCTKTSQRRTVTHSIFKPTIDRVTLAQQTPFFKKLMRKRQVWIEPKFGEVKEWHQGRRCRLRGLLKVNCEALLKASGQNIKQLLKQRPTFHHRQPPTMAIRVIAPSLCPAFCAEGRFCAHSMTPEIEFFNRLCGLRLVLSSHHPLTPQRAVSLLPKVPGDYGFPVCREGGRIAPVGLVCTQHGRHLGHWPRQAPTKNGA